MTVHARIAIGLAALLALTASASAHVSIPPGAPTGVANQGARIYQVTMGRTPTGTVAVQVVGVPAPSDTSLHFYVCWDEGLPTEKDEKKAGGNFAAGSVRSAKTQPFAPAGAKTCHWVITWDEDGTVVFAAEGTLSL